MKILSYILISFTLLAFYSCRENPPLIPDGGAKLKIIALSDTSTEQGIQKYAALKNAKITLVCEYGTFIKQTNDDGSIEIDRLPASTYQVSVRAQHPTCENLICIGSLSSVCLENCQEVCDTVIAKTISCSGISINEVYYVGPVNSIFYFYDQFIELYNSSDSIKYLDGMMIAKLLSDAASGARPGEDINNDGNIDGIGNGYFFKFPGNPGEKNYPFYPKTFIVLASDATNHTKMVTGSIDLNNADWEFYNQYSANDVDNPNSKNLENMRPEIASDFLLSLTVNVIILTDGTDTNWEDGISISSVLDGVELKTANSEKTLSSKIDRGFFISPARYSGKSVQRKEPGLDANNSSTEWEIIEKPTPGY